MECEEHVGDCVRVHVLTTDDVHLLKTDGGEMTEDFSYPCSV